MTTQTKTPTTASTTTASTTTASSTNTSSTNTSTTADLRKLLAEGARPWYRRALVWIAALAVVLAAAGAWWWRASRAEQAQPSYSSQPAKRGDITLTVTANGTIQPTRTINVGSELSGTVQQVLVDVNDRVTKGQVLAVLDPAKLRDTVDGSKAALAAARAKVAQTAATVQEARAAMDKLDAVAKLSGGKVPSKAELDSGRATLARALADDQSAKASVTQAQTTLSTNEINLAKASIRAPADGMVLTRNIDPGNAVAASLQAVTLFTIAEDLTKLRLWVYVDEADVGSVKLDQDATFTVSSYPGRPFPARVTRVGFGSTITENVVTYLTYLDVDNPDLVLRPGMTATATIVAAQHKNVLQVPNTALRFTPSSSSGAGQPPGRSGVTAALMPRIPSSATKRSAAEGANTALARQVWVLPAGSTNGHGTPTAVAVTPGISDGRMTEITGGELQEGMQVITNQMAAAK